MKERALGVSLSISIGTAIPFEEKIVSDADKPDIIYVNMRTLIRNYYEAWSSKERPPIGLILPGVIEEIETIDGLITNQKMAPYFYLPSHASVHSDFPNAVLKPFTNDKRQTNKLPEGKRNYAIFEQAAITTIKGSNISFLEADYVLPGNGERIWLFSHFPIDLLSRFNFSSMTLLESYTGNLKNNTQWISKLTKNEELQHLPFGSFMMQVLGDGVLFSPQPKGVKSAALNLAKEYRWNSLTTRTRMRENIALSKTDYKEILLSLLKTKL